MSAELLRRAAALLRSNADALPNETAARWDEWWSGGDRIGTYVRPLSPVAVRALADWLDVAARAEEYGLAEFGYRTAPNEATAFAREILRDGES